MRGAEQMTIKNRIICMRFPLSCLSFLTVALGPFISPCLHAQSPQHTALVEAAKKEGKLVWYTSMAVDTSKPLLDAFLKDYPFIQAELVSRALVTPEDIDLFLVTDDVDRARAEICGFYANYDSMRFVGNDLVVRLRRALRIRWMRASKASGPPSRISA